MAYLYVGCLLWPTLRLKRRRVSVIYVTLRNKYHYEKVNINGSIYHVRRGRSTYRFFVAGNRPCLVRRSHCLLHYSFKNYRYQSLLLTELLNYFRLFKLEHLAFRPFKVH
jgi:hypothetical protein